jgi:segregation and condensation protein B
MGKRPRRRGEPPDLGLGSFQQPPEDDPGMSLDELSQAYASLLEQGADPYDEAPAAEPELGADAAAGPDETPDAEWDEPAEPDHDAACPITPRSIFESMLFVGHPGNEPLTSEKVASLMRGVRPQEVDGLVVELNQLYEEEGCPYHIESVGRGYRLALREELSGLRDKFYGRIRAAKLSQAAIDILAIVAYRQPATREEIDALRSRPSGALLHQLVRRQLLRVERSSEKPRVVRYHTTARFLEFFGMESLKDLPKSPDGSF